MNSHIEKVTIYSGTGKNPMTIPEEENPLPETNLSSNNDNRWPEGTLSDSPSENPGARGRSEISDNSGASVPSTNPMLMVLLCIGIFSLVLEMGLK